jgi:hypothetical protein
MNAAAKRPCICPTRKVLRSPNPSSTEVASQRREDSGDSWWSRVQDFLECSRTHAQPVGFFFNVELLERESEDLNVFETLTGVG